jgi:hypothetical protein
MNCEDVNDLVKDMAKLIRFHELESIDSRAVELLVKAAEIEDVEPVDEEKLDEWLEAVRVDNLNPLAP